MEYVNVGAWVSGARPASKAALKRALSSDPASILFTPTSMLHRGPASYRPDDIPAGVSLSVVGPDPETSRKWYATVELRNGKVRIT